jgi:hypothetical protein
MHMSSTCRQDACPASRQALEVGDARLVHLPHRVEDGGHQDVAAVVRLELCRVPLRIRAAGLPASFIIREPQRIAQAVVLFPLAAERLAELERDGAKRASLLQIAADGRDLRAQHIALPEVLQERDQVGERFVQGRHIRMRAVELHSHAGQHRVRQLVRDDVLREAGEDRNPWKRRVLGTDEAPEAEAPAIHIVVRIGVEVVVRVNPQLTLVFQLLLAVDRERFPVHGSAERPLEVADGTHRDGVYHLLPE